MKFKSEHNNPKKFSTSAYNGIFPRPIKLYCDASFLHFNVLEIYTLSGKTVDVSWGDGTWDYGISIPTGHTYSDHLIHEVTIYHPENINKLYVAKDYYPCNFIPAGYSINEFAKAINMTDFRTNRPYDGGIWVGNIALLPDTLEIIYMNGNPYGVVGGVVTGDDLGSRVTGDITSKKNLVDLHLYGQNTVYGDMTGCDKLDCIYISGLNTITGDVSTWTKIRQIEGDGYNTLYGSLTNAVDFEFMCISGLNTITCDITGKTKLTYLSNNHSSFSGDVSGLINMWYLDVPGVTGSLTNLTKLAFFRNSDGLITKPASIITNPALQYFVALGWVLSSSDVNQYLADLWTNRNDPKSAEAIRYIDITGAIGTGAPTGQGIIDKAALQAYRSPTPPGTAALWSVYTR